MRLKSTIMDSLVAKEAVVSKSAGFENHLRVAMEQLGYEHGSWELKTSPRNVLLLTGGADEKQYKELAEKLKPDFNANYNSRHKGLTFGAVTPLFREDLRFKGKKAQTQTPSLEKIMATLQKGLPGIVTTLNMSATQAESIFKAKKSQKNAHRAYKKLVLAANLVQESLTLIGKVKLVEPKPKPAPEPEPVPETQPAPAAAPAAPAAVPAKPGVAQK